MSSAPVSTRGVLASVLSSVGFGAIYFLTPMLAPASAELLWAVRNIVTVLLIAGVLIALRSWNSVVEIAGRIRRKPLLLAGVFVTGFLLSFQVWLFSWAPLNGAGLEVALGYFLLPLVLVLVGRFVYKDRLKWWQWMAAGIAALGVGAEVIRVGGVSWATLAVALGYPAYFILRRRMGLQSLGAMWWEMAALTPVALVVTVFEIAVGGSLQVNPMLFWAAPVFGVLSAVSMALYLIASRMLMMSLFGLLSYLEPALLVVAAMLNGERIPVEEWFTYGAIWTAVLVILVGGTLEAVRRRGGAPGDGDSGDGGTEAPDGPDGGPEHGPDGGPDLRAT